MSTNEVVSELEQRVACLEAALAQARDDNVNWDRIFTESYWGMMVCDAITDELLKVNISYAEMHGYNILELLGKTIYDVFAPEYHSELPEIIHRITSVA